MPLMLFVLMAACSCCVMPPLLDMLCAGARPQPRSIDITAGD